MNLLKVREAFDTDSFSKFDIIVNKKVADGVPVIQLETAIGAAIQCFKNSCAIEVPRTRFLPGIFNFISLFLYFLISFLPSFLFFFPSFFII